MTPETQAALDRLQAIMAAGYFPSAEQCQAEDDLADVAQALAELEAAAQNLVGEVLGALGIAEPELRAALGNTNVQCLKNRTEQVRALWPKETV